MPGGLDYVIAHVAAKERVWMAQRDISAGLAILEQSLESNFPSLNGYPDRLFSHDRLLSDRLWIDYIGMHAQIAGYYNTVERLPLQAKAVDGHCAARAFRASKDTLLKDVLIGKGLFRQVLKICERIPNASL
jgi:hypothetical protein